MEQNTPPNNESGQFATVYKLASAIMMTVLIATGGIAFALFFEPEGRYFVSSPAVTAFYVIIAIAITFALSAFFMFKGNTVCLPTSPANRIAAALSAIASAVPFIYYIYSDASARIASFSASIESATTYKGLDFLSSAIMAIAAISLICSLYLTIRENQVAALIGGYARVIFLALIITKLYLDFSVELNSPIKISVQFGAVAAMLATTACLRPIVGKKKAATFMLTQFISAAICLLCFILFLTEIAPHSAKYTTDLFAFPIMLLALGLESVVNLFLCRIEEHTTPTEAQIEISDNAAAQGEGEITEADAFAKSNHELNIKTSSENTDEESIISPQETSDQ